MIEIEHSNTYPQDTDQVFAALTDIPGYPVWQADVLSATAPTGATLAEGAMIEQVRKVMGRKTDVTLTVGEYRPGTLLTLRTVDGTTPAVQQRYEVHAEGSGSRVEFRLQLDGVPKMAEHLAKAQLGKAVPKMFAALGEVLAA